jgi:hypothetical protein
MKLQKINAVYSKPLQAQFDVLLCSCSVTRWSLCGQYKLFPSVCDGLPDTLFTCGVTMGRVDEGHSKVETPAYNADGLRFRQSLNRNTAEAYS